MEAPPSNTNNEPSTNNGFGESPQETTVTPEVSSESTTPTPPARPNPQSIYPTALSYDERAAKKEEQPMMVSKSSAPISVRLVALLGAAASVYGLYSVVKVFFLSSALTLDLVIGTGGFFGGWSWLVLLISLFQYSAMLYACYKIWQGSMGGLAFLTGISFTLIYGLLIALPIIFQNLGDMQLNILALYLAYTVFYISLGTVWIKDRGFFR